MRNTGTTPMAFRKKGQVRSAKGTVYNTKNINKEVKENKKEGRRERKARKELFKRNIQQQRN